jgi:carboxypeptidase Q
MTRRWRFGLACGALLALTARPADAAAQGRPVGAVPPAPLATPIPDDSLPPYVRRTPPEDEVILRIWDEGMRRSQVDITAQVLLDSIGARLTGSPNMTRAQEWAVAWLEQHGVSARREAYGTWNSWRRGPESVALLAPRVQSLDARMLSWSGSTGGRAVEGGVARIVPYATYGEYVEWLRTVRGKVILSSAPRLSCRSPSQLSEFGLPATVDSLAREQALLDATYRGLTQRVPRFYEDVAVAGALAVFESTWSSYPGIQRIFGSPRNGALPTLDIGCEDYAMLFRLAERNQGAVVRVMAESESLGEQPVFNVIGTVPGRELPNEYVVLSAHFDSWEGHSGATDNGSGSLVMLEAIRILQAVYPKPRRTILIGLWSGEEQGLNGSGSFVADHPEIIRGLQFAFNQDNGTGRIVSTGPNILPQNGPRLARYLSAIPRDLTEWVRLQSPGPIPGGTDVVSFACHGAPAVNLNALPWDYSYTTWHTTRDSYDKIVFDDLRRNATLTAMLAYLASEDPERTSRELLDPMPLGGGGQPISIPNCGVPMRESGAARR